MQLLIQQALIARKGNALSVSFSPQRMVDLVAHPLLAWNRKIRFRIAYGVIRRIESTECTFLWFLHQVGNRWIALHSEYPWRARYCIPFDSILEVLRFDSFFLDEAAFSIRFDYWHENHKEIDSIRLVYIPVTIQVFSGNVGGMAKDILPNYFKNTLKTHLKPAVFNR